MNHFGFAGLFAVRFLLRLLVLVTMAANVQALPRIPANDAEILERLPARAGKSVLKGMAGLRAALIKNPTDTALAGELAQIYFDLAVASGDPRYVGYAEAVVNRFANPLPTVLLSLRGMLRQYRHDFSGALQDFADVLRLQPDKADAHAWRGAIFLVQADYAGAQKECDALAKLGREILASGCRGLVLAYGGQVAAGYKVLSIALSQASDPGNRLWILTRLGELAAWQGKSDLAKTHYAEALGLGLDDVYLLAAWEASDSLLLRLTQAEASLNRPGAARHQQMLLDRYAAARERGDTTHRAEEARFELHLHGDVPAALRLAQANYEVQREPRDARVLLEASIAAKKPAAAQAVRDWLQRSGFEDPRTRRLAQVLEQTGSSQ
jgi:hypothetical protein